MRLVNKSRHNKRSHNYKNKETFVENGYKLTKFDRLLGLYGETLPRNDILVMYEQ